MLDANALPNDVEALKCLVLEREAVVARRELTIRERDRQIEHLKLQLARLRRWKFGQMSESLEGAGQIALSLEEIKAAVARASTSAEPPAQVAPEKSKPVRRQRLPEHFERIDNLIKPSCTCPDCGGPMSELGQPDVAEVVQTKTVTFTVTRHIRPKMRCSKCSRSCRHQRRRGLWKEVLPAPRSSR